MQLKKLRYLSSGRIWITILLFTFSNFCKSESLLNKAEVRGSLLAKDEEWGSLLNKAGVWGSLLTKDEVWDSLLCEDNGCASELLLVFSTKCLSIFLSFLNNGFLWIRGLFRCISIYMIKKIKLFLKTNLLQNFRLSVTSVLIVNLGILKIFSFICNLVNLLTYLHWILIFLSPENVSWPSRGALPFCITDPWKIEIFLTNMDKSFHK